MVNLNGRDLLTLIDYSPAEIKHLVDLSYELKKEKIQGRFPKRLNNKNIALIFEKPSTRTRCAFTVACYDEGAHPEYLGKGDIQMGKKESIADTARVLSRYFDGIEFRGFEHRTVEELAKFSTVPVWNGLTDQFHPTQILADLLTIKENFGDFGGLKMVYMGDGRNNMAISLMIGSAKMGIDFGVAAPKSLWPEEQLIGKAKDIAGNNSRVDFSEDPYEAVKGVDVVYTDVWVSMGEEDKPGMSDRIKSLEPYQITTQIMEASQKDGAIFLHCLPAVHGREVTEEVFEGKWSKVFDQAENRLHTIKAVMVASIGV